MCDLFNYLCAPEKWTIYTKYIHYMVIHIFGTIFKYNSITKYIVNNSSITTRMYKSVNPMYYPSLLWIDIIDLVMLYIDYGCNIEWNNTTIIDIVLELTSYLLVDKWKCSNNSKNNVESNNQFRKKNYNKITFYSSW